MEHFVWRLSVRPSICVHVSMSFRWSQSVEFTLLVEVTFYYNDGRMDDAL